MTHMVSVKPIVRRLPYRADWDRHPRHYWSHHIITFYYGYDIHIYITVPFLDTMLFQMYCILGTHKFQVNKYEVSKKMAGFGSFILLLFYILRTLEKRNCEVKKMLIKHIRDL